MKKLYISGILFLLLCAAGCIMPRKRPQKALDTARSFAPFDVLIVPGTPFDGEHWDTLIKGRVLWSWILYKNGIVKNIIYSGGAVYTPYKEAHIMGAYGIALGIPPENIHYDTLAEHSTENIYYSYLLAGRLGYRSIALGTDPFQSFTLRGYIRKRFSTQVMHLPFVVDSLAVYNHLNPEITYLPLREGDWKNIKERESFFKRLGGTFGQHIPWKDYPDGRVPPLGSLSSSGQ